MTKDGPRHPADKMHMLTKTMFFHPFAVIAVDESEAPRLEQKTVYVYEGRP